MSYTEEIKHAIEKENILTGRDTVIKALKKGTVKKVFLTTNYADKDSVRKLCKINDVELEELKETNEELGAFCKTPFSISIMGIVKE